jgi:membrane-associated protein
MVLLKTKTYQERAPDVSDLIDFILHIDEHLQVLLETYGLWTHGLLFGIIFLETGLVITPFLPGDSLLFAAGAFAARGSLNIVWLFLLLSLAAIIGDSVNYAIGHFIGPRAFEINNRFIKRVYLTRTQQFYEKHGGKTIFLARFVPIVRTFAPFVAGIGTMNYSRFILYNIFGAVVWTGLFLLAGYFFGNLPFVQHNFTLLILAIIAISVLPIVFEFIKHRLTPTGSGRV